MTDPSAGGDHDPEREPRVVVRDRRRIDPQTGAARASGDEEEIDVTDSAIGGVPTPGRDAAGDDQHTIEDGVGVDTIDVEVVDEATGAAVPAEAGSAELDRVRSELAERTADLQRVSAEYANYRRRVDRDRDATVAAAKAQVAGELLTVLDDVERAASHGDLTGPFKVVADRLTETLTRIGLTPFGTEGDAFDPSVHEAVAQGSSADVSGPTVTTVMRRGYRFGERVLRPAMVEVTDHDHSTTPTEPATADDAPAVDLPESQAAGNPGAINPDAT